jgi:hypothetical protein
MLGHGKCPRCGEPVGHCELDKIIIGDKAFGPFFHGVAMCCPNPKCQTVLGVSIDPSSLAYDVAHQVMKKIEEKRA